ncbi:MAG: hypothetical protein Q7T51_01325 [Candidatus Moranbacteria bacterium]|nr:hypothetical protein [Candidatus Moranbacteria bacterium]
MGFPAEKIPTTYSDGAGLEFEILHKQEDLRDSKSKQDGKAEAARISKSGGEIINTGAPTIANIVTNFEKLKAAREEFEVIAQSIRRMTDPALRDIKKISALVRIQEILDYEDIQPRELTPENRDNTSREKYKTELQRLAILKRELEKL